MYYVQISATCFNLTHIRVASFFYSLSYNTSDTIPGKLTQNSFNELDVINFENNI